MEIAKKENSRANPRNNDKRRERSKVAARCRRGKESEIFANLASCLPLAESVRAMLDKASIARIAVTYLKLQEMMNTMFPSGSIEVDAHRDLEFDSLTNNALGGFVIVFSSDGDVIYVSESITQHLGLSQCEVMGHSVYDFSHPCDHVDIKELFAVSKTDKQLCQYRTGFFRMKCTITSKGRSVHLRAASYKAINCTGHLFSSDNIASPTKWYVGIGEPIPDPTNIPFPLNKQAFVTRHSTDMKCEDVAGSVEDFLGYVAEDLIGKSLFEFHHAADGLLVGRYFKSLYLKGQIQTDRYRFLARYGGWVWVTTQATVLKCNNEPSGVVCLHFVTSDIENREEILSTVQVPLAPPCSIILDAPVMCDTKQLASSAIYGNATVIEDLEKENFRTPVLIGGAGLSSPTPSTSKIFAPRTEDMDSGFLLPCDNTIIGEPDDLTHLAPIAGDECVSLNVPLLDDLLKSFDQANMEYTLSGYTSDAADDIPYHLSHSTVGGNNSKQELCVNTVVSDTSSLLFHNSDPNMGGACDFDATVPSPVQMQSSPDHEETNSNSSCMSEMPFTDFQPDNEDSMQLSPGNSFMSNSKKYLTSNEHPFSEASNSDIKTLEVDDLSVFTAPYIPLGPEDDFTLLDAGSEFTWPPGLEIIQDPTDEVSIMGSTERDSVILDRHRGVKYEPVSNKLDILNLNCNQFIGKPMLKDDHIDKVRWTVDIESILGSRKPGDLPKVVTKYIFSNTGPPAMKVRKLGLSLPKQTNSSVLFGGDVVADNGSPEKFNEPNRIPANSSEIPEGRRLASETGIVRYASSFTALEEGSGSAVRKRDLFGKLLGNDSSGVPTLFELTRQDCDVNVPLEHSSLLQGADLIIALESENSVDSVQ